MTVTTRTVLLRSSTGPVVRTGDFVLARYQGHIVDANGKNTVQFDANYDFSTFAVIPGRTPFEFQLGSGSVIQGWEKGLVDRRIGEVVELTIPPSEGYGNIPRDRIPAGSTLRFRVEIVGGFTPDTFSPGSSPGFRSLSLGDLGINPRNIGLTTRDLFGISSSIVGLNVSDILTGNDVVDGVSSERARRDLLIGLGGADTITGRVGGDLLIGGNEQDTFRYVNLTDSTLSQTDRILDFQIGTDRIDGPTAVTAANTRELGTVATFNQAGISAVLTTAVFGANQAATFTFRAGTATRTFLALNDSTAGFSSTSDALIEITGYTGLLTNLAIV
jgi:serralysin